MARFVVHHRHDARECPAAFAAWRGFSSPLRGADALASCRFGGHELWLALEAGDENEALAQLPRYVAERSKATRIHELQIP